MVDILVRNTSGVAVECQISTGADDANQTLAHAAWMPVHIGGAALITRDTGWRLIAFKGVADPSKRGGVYENITVAGKLVEFQDFDKILVF